MFFVFSNRHTFRKTWEKGDPDFAIKKSLISNRRKYQKHRRFIENITYCEALGVYGIQKLFLFWRETEDKNDHYVSLRVFFLCEAIEDAGV